jgi:hypothetical protein
MMCSQAESLHFDALWYLYEHRSVSETWVDRNAGSSVCEERVMDLVKESVQASQWCSSWPELIRLELDVCCSGW